MILQFLQTISERLLVQNVCALTLTQTNIAFTAVHRLPEIKSSRVEWTHAIILPAERVLYGLRARTLTRIGALMSCRLLATCDVVCSCAC